MSKGTLSTTVDEDSFNLDTFSSEESLPAVMFDAESDVAQLYEYHLHTVCAMAIKCEHNSMPLSSLHATSKSSGLWLPYVSIKLCYNVDKVAARMTEFFLKELNFSCDRNKLRDGEMPLLFEKIVLHSIHRIQISNGEFIEQLVYMARWKSTDKNCCKNSTHIKWIPIGVASKSTSILKSEATTPNNEHLDMIARFWGSEVSEYAKLCTQDKLKLLNVIEQTTDQVFMYVKRKVSSSIEVILEGNESAHQKPNDLLEKIQFVTDSHVTEADVVKIYCDFVQHCFPSIDMSFVSFKDYCLKIGLSLTEDRLVRFFRAMNYRDTKNYITFNEFLLGMIAMDPASPQRLPRYSFLFRYYDQHSDGTLDKHDLAQFMADLGKAQTDDTNYSILEFVEAIESKRLKDTTGLCRVSKSVVLQMHEANAYELIMNKHSRPFGPPVQATCGKCKPKNYSLALHSVKLSQTGRIEEPKATVKLDNVNPSKEANRVLQLVRKLAGFSRMTDEKKKEVRSELRKGLTVNLIKDLCDEVGQIVAAEPRVLSVNTPTFVLGDIHGNINDLLNYEEQLWPMAPVFNGPSALFLGDYVDRGEFSIEVACYLFAMKVLAPNKFFLIRGNHEVRQVQRQFTFEKECNQKYDVNGQCVFELFNRVFDFLPFAAVIDELIFCAHGGIPYSLIKIEDLKRLPNIISVPQETPAVHEILWNDPIPEEEYKKTSELQRGECPLHKGYLHNTKRSTGYYFGESATANFLAKNNLTHVIRAHELIKQGYKFDHNGTVITVFSSSHYSKDGNEAAVLMVEANDTEGFIKIITPET